MLKTSADVLTFFADKGELPGNVSCFSASVAVSYPGAMAPLSLVEGLEAVGLLEIRTESVPLAGPMAARVAPIRHTKITSAGKLAAEGEDSTTQSMKLRRLATSAI